ncbi:MAG: hypothetical protein M1575_03585 [Patescibacteria group bacterium]|nr:hypothetical protein [Patescibacteria group bacterium]MCL5095781.1 hypothetical protein [Patescibacteria group bacterium]
MEEELLKIPTTVKAKSGGTGSSPHLTSPIGEVPGAGARLPRSSEPKSIIPQNVKLAKDLEDFLNGKVNDLMPNRPMYRITKGGRGAGGASSVLQKQPKSTLSNQRAIKLPAGSLKLELPFQQSTLNQSSSVPIISRNTRDILTGEGLKEKKLVGRLKTNEKYPTELRQMLEGTYVPQSNAQTISNAKKLVRLDPNAAEARAMNPQNAVDQAIGAELFNYHMDKGNVAKANEILNATAGTNEGQMIQILSQYDKTTPQGAIKFAQNAVKEYNKIHVDQPLQLSDTTIQDIYKKAKNIQVMPEGRERNIAANDLINQVNNLIPSSIVDKAVTVWKAGLLTSLRTHERNLLGNTIHGAAEVFKDIPATATDMLLSLKTGKRTLTPTFQGTGSGAKQGLQAGKDIIIKGYDPEQAISKYDVQRVTWGNNPIEQALKIYTETVFRTLGALQAICMTAKRLSI